MSGLSIANNVLAGGVQFNLDRNQAALKNTVSQLSSGLRINSAADDPSGLAIATNLQTQVDAFNSASQNVQNANNAAQVADGALATETDILQRIRGLAVEASSSINSASDTANLQAEVSQLLLEVNRISQSVNFNGQPLLDGSHAGFQPYTGASYSITTNAVLANAGAAGGAVNLVNGDFSNPPVPANSGVPFLSIPGWTVNNVVGIYNTSHGGDVSPAPGAQAAAIFGGMDISQTLTGLTPGGSYQVTYQAGTLGGAVLQLDANGTIVNPVLNGTFQTFTTTFTANGSGQATLTFKNTAGGDVDLTNVSVAPVGSSGASGNPGELIAGVSQVSTTAAGFITSSNAGAGGAGTIFNTTSSGAVDGTIELQVVNTSSTTVGVEVQFFTSASSSASTVTYYANAAANSLISVDGLNITIGNVSLADAGTTAYLKVSQATAATSSPSGPFTIQSGSQEGDTVQIGIQATNAQTLRISNIDLANTNSPVLAAEDAIGQIDNALQTLLNQRAQLGAAIVRLNEDADNDSVASVNLQSSESAIRDLNVGEATTEFTKLQVLVQVGTSVLAQSNSNASSILGLFR